MSIDKLNKLVRSELSSIETYQQALDKHRREFGHMPEFQQLSQIQTEHREALSRLRNIVQQHGGTPSTDPGAWGTWAKIVMAGANLFGDKTGLKALKEGEESGLKEYQSVAEDPDTPTDVRTNISTLMANQRQHVVRLDAMMNAMAEAT